MSNILLFEAKNVLKELKDLRRKLSHNMKKLEKYNNYILKKTRRRGSAKNYYYLQRKGKPERRYLGTDSNETVNLIKEARFLEKLISVVDRDIKLLEQIDSDFIIPDFFTINNSIPETYRSERPLIVYSDSNAAENWKKKREEEKSMYEPFRPYELVHSALDGTMMRSTSEVVIANYLMHLGIVFVYELPIKHHGKMVLPDFTILSPVDNKTEIIIEHQGAMSSEKYQEKFIQSILFYLQTKLVPNMNLFFTFNHIDGNLDLRQIDSILHIAFGI